ncbi:MAG TPA: TIM barrel protein [Planctomycetota bacterium]|nr:TIM barrel protein [Planctomycetota bacterium]
MRLGGPIFSKPSDPESWVSACRAKGYRAAFCPLPPEASDADCSAWSAAAAKAGLVIAEVGAWSNPLSTDSAERSAAMEKCRKGLDLAERVGARCCVNISGSRGAKWDGPHPQNLTAETFAMIVDCVRAIIDAVRPRRTFYTLETMPWMYPDSAESYARLLAAIDRPAFAVHFDPVNLVASPQLYAANGAMVRDFVKRLGPRIRSCHAKDIRLAEKLTVHLDEVRPGTGGLDYRAYLSAVAALDPDTPVMLEHLPSEAEYDLAAGHLREVARAEGLAL